MLALARQLLKSMALNVPRLSVKIHRLSLTILIDSPSIQVMTVSRHSAGLVIS